MTTVDPQVTPFLLADIATGVTIGLGGALVILAGVLAFFREADN